MLNVISEIVIANGEGVERDLKKAAKLYQLSADQGESIAQCNLGTCYAEGIGVEKDVRSSQALSLSGRPGRSKGSSNLGNCYSKGEGVEKDVKEAVRLYR